MEKVKSIRVANNQAELDKIVEFVEATGIEWNFNAKLSGEINLMLEELFVNTVSYGYPDQSEGSVEIKLSAGGGELAIEFSDDGEEFNPLSIAAADTELDIMHRKIGGLGMHLIRQISDSVEYKRNGNFNTLIIRKKIN
ncbi:MAG TPA: ATP-binding protein [Candidatus Wallbacteria bacterium]|nr:MAG: serine-protein kinase RsbW [bacterium ADurb.Bin243]HOD42567.1 ATP-binding protein [Candidatus Wallbacteria bacterium]HPG57250.1 ATP-binding protein [Candidatus Wallbacteria bacterium]